MENGTVTELLRFLHYATLPGAAALLCVLVFTGADRRRGRLLFLTLSAAVSLNCLLKTVFRIPRPWLDHPETAPLFAEGGYALPCLHTQITAAVLCALLLTSRKRPFRFLCAAGILTAAAVRLISGLQSPADILTALAAGILCAALICRFLYCGKETAASPITQGIVLILCGCSAVFCRDAWGPGLFLAAAVLGLSERAFRKADPGRTRFGRLYGMILSAGLYAGLIIFLPFLAEWLLPLHRAADPAAVFLSALLPCLLPVFPLF